MNEPFFICIGEQEFKARFERWGYTHRIAVLIDEVTFTFEPDEEGGYQALIDSDAGKVNISLLQAIAEKLAKLSSQ